MNRKVDKQDLFKRFFNNRYSRQDYRDLKKLLLSQDPEFTELMKAHWEKFSPDSRQYKDLSGIFGMINRELDRQPATGFRKVFRGWSRVAAVLFLPLLAMSVWLYLWANPFLYQEDVYVEVTSPAGSRTTLNLPDGSAVWLNGDSHISYPAAFGKNRQVTITGEAFFKVQSDDNHPFMVNIGTLWVKATGTEFNVSSYPDEASATVILKEGKVTVLNARKEPMHEMEEGYRYQYDGNISEPGYMPVNVESYSGWINGRLIFENATMEEVVRRMERWYGVRIEVMDQDLLQLHFKATFINESIEEALKLLQSTAIFNYRFGKREQMPDGSLTQTVIYITKT